MPNVLGIAALLVGCAAVSSNGDDPPAAETDADRKGLQIEVTQVAVSKLAEIPGLSVTARLSNPDDGVVYFMGYTPDSFAPPLKKGQISPIYRLQFRNDGKWVDHTIGWCGTGMGAIPLTHKEKPTFGMFAAGVTEWEAVRVGITVLPGPDFEHNVDFKVVWSPPVKRKPHDD